MMWRLLMASCLFVGGSQGAVAAMLQAIQGDVMINAGDGFKRVAGPTQVNPGDYVMVGPGGKANLVYPGGEIVPVQEGGVFAVAEQPPVIDPNAPAVEGVADQGTTGSGSETPTGGMFSGPSGVVLGVVTAAAVVGGVVALASSSGSSSSSPASP
jgi:hypothetical protein